MNRFYVAAIILLLLTFGCTKRQDLVQKAFENKDFDTMLADSDQKVEVPDDEDEKDEKTKVEVLVDNLGETDTDSVFLETGSADHPENGKFKKDSRVKSLKFDEVSLYEVVQTLLNELEENYIIDPVLKDQAVTLDIKPGGKGFLYSDLLDLLLKLHDLTMIVHEEYIHVVPIDSPAVNPGLRLLHGSRPNKNLRKEEMAIQIIPLAYVTPADVNAVVKEFLSPAARVYEEPKNNVLVVVDKYQYIAKVMEIIPIFDVDVLANKKMIFYQLAHVDATDTANRLQEILGVYGYEPDGERLSIIPIDTLNGILVVANASTIFKELDFWIKKFDQEAQFEEDQVFIYQVQNTTADSISWTLSQIYDINTMGGGGGRVNQGASSRRSTSPGAGGIGGGGGNFGNSRGGFNNNRNNNNFNNQNRGNLNSRNQNNQNFNNQGNFNRQGGANNNRNQTGGFNNRNQTGGFNQNQRGGFGNNRFGGANSSNNPDAPSMVVDDENNSLIFLTTPREYSRIQKTLKKLDILPRQVFLEVTVLTVQLNDAFAFGLNWSATDDESENTANSTDTFGALFGGDDASSLTGTYNYVGPTGSIIATVNALKSKGYTNLLQQPHIMAIDNQEASISVGTEIPIATSTTNLNNIADGTGVNPATSSTIQYRATGVNLSFLPHINANGVIRLSISLDISSPGASQAGSEAVPIDQNSLFTEMIVRDGQTAVMGGLILDRESWARDSVPLLGRIPILKHLFTDRNSSTAKSELVIMITPHLIDSEARQIEISKEFKEKILKEFETFKDNRQ